MSAPAIPRTEWEEHDNFPAHVLLLGSHANFKRISQHLVSQAETGGDRFSIGYLYSQWIGAMRNHEAYEERKLYPYLAKRWGSSFAAAMQGHQDLHTADDAVRAALAHEQADDAVGESEGEELASALREHDRVLVEHLREEEDQVVPLLLSLERQEFVELTSTSATELLAKLVERGF